VALQCQEVAEADRSLTPLLRAKLDTCHALKIIDEVENARAGTRDGDGEGGGGTRGSPKNSKSKVASGGNKSGGPSLQTGDGWPVQKPRLTVRQAKGLATSRRIEALKYLERALGTVGTNRAHESFLEELCVLVWNCAFPLIQTHLRPTIHSAFQLASQALESISSPLLLLRVQFHFELAKCEEAAEYVQKAKR